jgi:hypothetical protein
MSSTPEIYSPFAIFTYRLIVLPTPTAVNLPAYRTLYAQLSRLPTITTRAFGPDFPRSLKAQSKSEIGVEEEGQFAWEARGLGNCAVGLKNGQEDLGRVIKSDDGVNVHVRIVEGEEFQNLVLSDVRWLGYVGVRIPQLPPRGPGDMPLPQWQEMVELRYGFTSAEQRSGWGTEAARGLMLWAEKEAGVRGFIAQTDREAQVCDEILRKVGFHPRSGVEYWKKSNRIEWGRTVNI